MNNVYRDYLIIFVKNNYYTSCLGDLEILQIIGFNNELSIIDKLMINYIIVDNLEIVSIKKFENNNYDYYWKLFIMYKVIYYIKKNT